MLTNKQLISSRNVVEHFSFNGKGLSTVSGTPLGQLVEASVSDVLNNMDLPVDDGLTAVENAVRVASQTNHHRDHTVLMAETVKDSVQAMNAIVHAANAEVLPLVGSIIDACNQAISTVKENAVNPVQVINVTLSDLMSDPQIDTFIVDYESAKPNVEAEYDKVLGYVRGLDQEVLLKLLSTDIPELDEKVKAAAVNEDGVWPNTHFEEYLPFARGVLTNRQSHKILQSNTNVLMMLLTGGLTNNVMGDVPSDVRAAALELRRYAEIAHKRQMEQCLEGLNQGRIVWGNEGASVVYVEARAYREWLKSGGSIEAMMGAPILAKQEGIRTLNNQLLEKIDACTEAYNRQVRADRLNESREVAQAVTTTLSRELAEEIKRRGLGNCKERLAKWTYDNPYTANQDMASHVLNGVLDVFELESTQVGMFIRLKREAAAALPDAEAKDITMAAVLRLMAKSLASQIVTFEGPSEALPVAG